jgi:hypothetical protein
MESWPPKKRVRTQRTAKSTGQNSEALLVACARLVTEVAGQQRTDRACYQRVALLPPKLPVAVAVLKAGQEYFDSKKSAAADQDADLVQEPDFPFVYVWKALVLALQQSDILSDDERSMFAAHSALMQTPDDVLDVVKVCKAKLTHKGDAVKLTISTDSTIQPMVLQMFRIFRRMGAVLKFGSIPPSTSERAVRGLLKQHE